MGRLAGRAVAILSRIALPLSVLVVAVVLGLMIWAVLPGRLSGSRLIQAITSFGTSVLAFVTSGIGLVVLGFVAGAAIGWFAGVTWFDHRLRARSLLLLDPRRADMSFVEGVDHVRSQSGTPRPGADQAANSIVEAAARGRLSLWQRSGTNVLQRVTPRQIRRAGSRLAIVAGELDGVDGDRGEWGGQERQGGVEFRLFRNEVEALWPTTRLLTIGPGESRRPGEWAAMVPSMAAGVRRTAKKLTKLK